jgi:hypothetical protein
VLVVGVKTGRVTKKKAPAKVKTEVVDEVFDEGLREVDDYDEEVEV